MIFNLFGCFAAAQLIKLLIVLSFQLLHLLTDLQGMVLEVLLLAPGLLQVVSLGDVLEPHTTMLALAV